MRRSFIACLLALVACISGLVVAEERPDQAIFWKIRQEGTNNSQILRTLHMLTDVYGPRLTGSPNLKAAGEWAIQQMQSWGMKNGHLEPWDFGHPGWTNERLAAYIVSPVKDTLVGEVLAWTPGTNGPVRGAAVQITLPRQPTREELAAHLEALKESHQGKDRPGECARRVCPSRSIRLPCDVRTATSSRRCRLLPLRRRDAVVDPPPARTAGTPPRRPLTGERARGAAQRVPRREWRPRPHYGCRPRSRADSRLQQSHLRRDESAAHCRDAQRGLRTHLAFARRQAIRRARVRHRQSVVSRGSHQLQRHCRDSRQRQG